MKVRYKDTGAEAHASQFNVSALAEVLTGDDSAFIKELDVWLVQKQCWKDMNAAFKDHETITTPSSLSRQLRKIDNEDSHYDHSICTV